MDSEYLKSTVGDLLAEGLSATVLKNPSDKIEYLAEWLIKTVHERQRAAGIEAALVEQRRRDAENEVVYKEEEEKEQLAAVSQEQTAAEKEKQFQALIANATSADALLPAFLQFLRDFTGASSAYIGRVETDKENETSSLRYVAATPENEWLLDKRLDSKKGRNTFEIFVADEEEPEEEDEDGKPIPRAPKPPKSVFVPNVLLGAKSQNVHFFKQPQLGSYTAVKMSFLQSVSDEALDEAIEREAEILQLKAEQDEAKRIADKEAADEAAREAGLEVDDDEEVGEDDEDEEEDDEEEIDPEDEEAMARRRKKQKRIAKRKAQEEKERLEAEESEEDREARLKREEDAKLLEEEEFLITQLNRAPIEYALCLDTLGQNKRFSEENLQTIIQYSELLSKKLQALDRESFSQQRKKRQALIEFNKEVAELNEAGTLRTEEEKAEELERLSDELEAIGKPMTDEDVVFKYRTELILSQLKSQISEWATHDVLRGPAVVLQAVFYLLAYPKRDVSDAEDKADWNKIRKHFVGDDFFTKLRDYDPRSTNHDALRITNPELLYTESVAVTKLVETLEYEEVKAKNYALSELLLWVREALAVKRRAKLERARIAKKARDAELAAEEARRLEEERAAEEAERIANGEAPEDGEPAEDGEEEEEDDE